MFTYMGVLIALILTIYVYFLWSFKYWQRRNVPSPKPKFPFGNIGNQTKKNQHLACNIETIYKEMKSKGCKYAGIYMLDSPIFMPIDVKLVKDMLTKDFSHFINHGIYYDAIRDPISAHLFALENNEWRKLRTCITPTFSIGKSKIVYDALATRAVEFKNELMKRHNNKETLDIKDLSERYIIDTVGRYNFGIECNSMKNPNDEFKKICSKAMETSLNISVLLTMMYPKIAKWLGIKAIDTEVSNFFINVIKSTVEYRDTTNTKRNDIINLLMELRADADKSKPSLTINQIAAQSFLMFQAGYETSSLTITYCIYELAKNQYVQQKVHDEIETVIKNHDGKMTYEGINEMKYLNMVIDETLRKYPPVPLLIRKCNRAYNVPNTDVIIEEGTKVFIPTYSYQHDPEYFPDPETFNPDRFLVENKGKLIPYTYLPFGEGPRICIGMKFGLLHVKMAVVTILKNFKLYLNARTPKELTFNPNAIATENLETVYIDTEIIK